MGKVFIQFRRSVNEGVCPGEVSIRACTVDRFYEKDNDEQAIRATMETDKTPRQLLQELKGMIFDATGESPSAVDMLWGREEEDQKQENSDSPRFISYLYRMPWEEMVLNGKELEESRKRTGIANRTRNDRILAVFNEYVVPTIAVTRE